jgi:hypothetical protein
MIDPENILDKVAKAKQDIIDAEKELETAIGELQVTPRAHKTTISKVVQDALGKVRTARADLEGLEKLVENEKE